MNSRRDFSCSVKFNGYFLLKICFYAKSMSCLVIIDSRLAKETEEWNSKSSWVRYIHLHANALAKVTNTYPPHNYELHN